MFLKTDKMGSAFKPNLPQTQRVSGLDLIRMKNLIQVISRMRVGWCSTIHNIYYSLSSTIRKGDGLHDPMIVSTQLNKQGASCI